MNTPEIEYPFSKFLKQLYFFGLVVKSAGNGLLSGIKQTGRHFE